MANKTRTDIINQAYEYLPNLNTTAHNTALDNLIDLAAEYISGAYNFSYLRATSPATHDVDADEYYVDESDFSFSNFKEILFLEWTKSATGENAQIAYLPQKEFNDRFRYISYSGNTDGKPVFYTRLGNRLLFNCQLDETVTVRAWYQKYHGAFTNDSASHSFEPDMLGFQAIVSVVMQEAQHMIPGLQLNQKSMLAAERAQYWINELIKFDANKADEGVKLGAKHMKEQMGGQTDPYYWL